MASGKLGLRLRLTKTTAAATDRQSSEVVTISPDLRWSRTLGAQRRSFAARVRGHQLGCDGRCRLDRVLPRMCRGRSWVGWPSPVTQAVLPGTRG
jgi:hypothetical protein